MIINRENIAQLGRSFKALSLESLANTQPRWQRLAMEVPSTTSQNDYGWLNDIPGMREWLGEREVKNLSTAGYSIKNKDFELTVGVRRPDIEDDNLGIYSPMFQQLGNAVGNHPDELVFALLVNGFTEPAYDGKAFFATDHKVGKKTFSNKGTKTLTRAEYRDALAKMRKVTNANGRPLRTFLVGANRKPILCVGPDNYSTALEIVGVPTLENGGANPDYNTAEIELVPEFIDAAATYWALLDVSFPIKGLILQRRKQPEFVRKDMSDDDNVFFENELIYGFDDRKNAGYGFWQLAFGSTGAAAGA